MKRIVRGLTANYGLRANLEGFAAAISVCDGRTKDHATSGRFFLTTTLEYASFLRESMFNIDVTFFEDANAVASDEHVLGRIHVNLDNDRSIEFALDARRRIFTADSTSLIEHVWSNAPEIGPDKDLESRRLVVANQTHDRKTVPGSIFYRTSRSFGLITRTMLLFRLTYYLQLSLTVSGYTA